MNTIFEEILAENMILKTQNIIFKLWNWLWDSIKNSFQGNEDILNIPNKDLEMTHITADYFEDFNAIYNNK